MMEVEQIPSFVYVDARNFVPVHSHVAFDFLKKDVKRAIFFK